MGQCQGEFVIIPTDAVRVAKDGCGGGEEKETPRRKVLLGALVIVTISNSVERRKLNPNFQRWLGVWEEHYYVGN